LTIQKPSGLANVGLLAPKSHNFYYLTFLHFPIAILTNVLASWEEKAVLA